MRGEGRDGGKRRQHQKKEDGGEQGEGYDEESKVVRKRENEGG